MRFELPDNKQLILAIRALTEVDKISLDEADACAAVISYLTQQKYERTLARQRASQIATRERHAAERWKPAPRPGASKRKRAVR